jgi:hypothetical protein
MMNLGRVAAGGRNWEGFGVDPYLTGIASVQTILGVQSTGVMANAKVGLPLLARGRAGADEWMYDSI